MTSGERVLLALNKKEPDRGPLFYRDVPEVEKRLLRDLNLPGREALLEYLGIDFRWVGPEYAGPDLSTDSPLMRRDIWGWNTNTRDSAPARDIGRLLLIR